MTSFGSTTVRFLGHATFIVRARSNRSLLIDPYPKEGFAGHCELAPIADEVDFVVSSHLHPDHNAIDEAGGAEYVAGERIAGPFQIERYLSVHDEHGGRFRGGPVELLRITVDGRIIVYASDLGEHPGPALQSWLSARPIDLLLLPAGGWFTLDAADAHDLSQRLGARVTVPYHCSDQGLPLPELTTSADYVALCDRVGEMAEIALPVTDTELPRQIVLTPRNRVVS